MTFTDLEIGEFYENTNGSVIYKCVEVTDTYALMIIYETAHRVVTTEFWDANNFRLKSAKIISHCGTRNYYVDVFNKDLQLQDEQTLTLKL